jgi:sucrose-6-phosphate hydrolase SacC (GH32 family)
MEDIESSSSEDEADVNSLQDKLDEILNENQVSKIAKKRKVQKPIEETKEIQSEEVPISNNQIMEDSNVSMDKEQPDTHQIEDIDSESSPEKQNVVERVVIEKSARSILSNDVDDQPQDDKTKRKIKGVDKKNISPGSAPDDQEYQYDDINSIEKIELIERLMVVRRTLLSNIEMFSNNTVLFNEFNMVF